MKIYVLLLIDSIFLYLIWFRICYCPCLKKHCVLYSKLILHVTIVCLHFWSRITVLLSVITERVVVVSQYVMDLTIINILWNRRWFCYTLRIKTKMKYLTYQLLNFILGLYFINCIKKLYAAHASTKLDCYRPRAVEVPTARSWLRLHADERADGRYAVLLIAAFIQYRLLTPSEMGLATFLLCILVILLTVITSYFSAYISTCNNGSNTNLTLK